MINISELSEEEMDYLIGKVNPLVIKKYYQSYPNEFGKLIKGFRSESVPDHIAISTAKKFKKKEFIISFIKKSIERWDFEIGNYMNRLEEKGFSHNAALFRTIPLSVYDDNINLFFKVREEVCTDEEIDKLKEAIERYGSSVDFEDNKDSTRFELSEYEAIVFENENLRNEIKRLSALIQEKADEASAIENKFGEKDYLEKFLDDAPDGKYINEDFPYLSICKVYVDRYTDKIWLSRLADIEGNEVVKFIQNLGMTPYFENRDRLYWKNGPSKENLIGVWRWNVTPNLNDSNTDYVSSDYCENVKIIEIIECVDVSTIKDLVELIKSGIKASEDGNKKFLAFKDDVNIYKGILLQEKDLDYEGDIAKIKKGIVAVPQFIINDEDCIYVNGHVIYKSLSMGIPVSVCKIMDPYELVRDILIARVSIPVLRQKGLSKKEAQAYQQILKETVGDSFYQEYAEKFNCTEIEAKKYVNTFVESADMYLTETDIETDILSLAISRNGELVKRCKSLIEDDWKKENETRIWETNKKIEALNDEIKQRNDEMKETEDNYLKYQRELSDREKLATDIEDKIIQNIEKAQSSIGNLLADAAFYEPIISAIRGSKSNEAAKVDAGESILTYDNSLQEYKLENDLEVIDDALSFKDELADILISAGFSRDGAIEISSVIVFCIEQKIPILCKSNGELIANCIASLFGKKKASVVNVPIGHKDGKLIRNIITTGDDRNVIYILGLFDGFSLNLFNTLIVGRDDWSQNVCIILSLDGINPLSLPDSILDNTFYIDGDIDFLVERKQCSSEFNTRFKFEHQFFNEDEIKKYRKDFCNWKDLIGNQAISRYASYLCENEETIEENWTVLTQIALRATMVGKLDEFREIVEGLKISEESKKHIAKYVGDF